MAHQQNIPSGQKWFTNVAIVSLDLPPNHFEIACYQNKIAAFRNNTEKDLSNVLQADDIFTNAIHGLAASNEQLMESFETLDKLTICTRILRYGKQQLTSLERRAETYRLRSEIIQKAAARCVNKFTQRPLPFWAFEQGIAETQWKINQFPVSEQATDLCERIGQVINLEMSQVDLILWFKQEDRPKLERVLDCSASVPDGLYWTLFCRVDSNKVGDIKGLQGVNYQVEKSFTVRVK